MKESMVYGGCVERIFVKMNTTWGTPMSDCQSTNIPEISFVISEKIFWGSFAFGELKVLGNHFLKVTIEKVNCCGIINVKKIFLNIIYLSWLKYLYAYMAYPVLGLSCIPLMQYFT